MINLEAINQGLKDGFYRLPTSTPTTTYEDVADTYSITDSPRKVCNLLSEVTVKVDQLEVTNSRLKFARGVKSDRRGRKSSRRG